MFSSFFRIISRLCFTLKGLCVCKSVLCLLIIIIIIIIIIIGYYIVTQTNFQSDIHQSLKLYHIFSYSQYGKQI